ncbi:PIN domain protein [uncultured archaeon]|nr:PIN domain protein [uncultured archaeon]
MKDELFLVDTNILVYSLDKSEPEKQKSCSSLIEKCWMQEESYAIALQNISEFYVVVTKKIENPLPTSIARKIVKDIIDFNNWQVISYDEASLITAIDMGIKYKIHYWDSLLCATMKQNGINGIYTENVKDFDKVPWVTAINPME